MATPSQILRELALAGDVERNLASVLPLVGAEALAEQIGATVEQIGAWVSARRVPPSYGGRIWAALHRSRRAEKDGPSFRHNGRWREYAEARAAGESVCAIARRLGVSHPAVSKALKHAEVGRG